jgi:putative membrane protein
MWILTAKALHIIFVVTWFAGLFYIVRLFIYHAEAQKLEEPKKSTLIEQYRIMEYRLWYYITWPSAILATAFGIYLMIAFSFWDQVWMIVKLGFVAGLWVYQFMNHKLLVEGQEADITYSSQKLRIWNEVATLFLFAIVFLVVLKSLLSVLWGIISLVAFAVLLFLTIKWYKKKRSKS